MRRLPAILLSCLLLLVLSAGAVWTVLRFAAHGFSARAQPTRVEAMLAGYARDVATPSNVRERRNPVVATGKAVQEGMAHFADHCAVCHANDGSGLTMLGEGMYPKPPDLRLAMTQGRTDGELFSIIENGVRMSGMPAFGGAGATDEQSWKLVVFLRHLPALTPAEQQAMEHLNPKSPGELKEEQQEDDFLRGADTKTAASKK